MENSTRIRLELDINAQKMVQQVEVHNKHIEEEISKGIQMALEEVLGDENFSLKVKEQAIKNIEDVVSRAVLSWEVKGKITKLIEDKIGQKLNEYAQRIADKLTEKLTENL